MHGEEGWVVRVWVVEQHLDLSLLEFAFQPIQLGGELGRNLLVGFAVEQLGEVLGIGAAP
jgi:hypothetical protein